MRPIKRLPRSLVRWAYDYGEDEDEYEFEPYEGEPEQDTTEDTDA